MAWIIAIILLVIYLLALLFEETGSDFFTAKHLGMFVLLLLSVLAFVGIVLFVFATAFS